MKANKANKANTKANTKREQIIESACQLIEMQGYHATGVNEILQESGAPRGSLYYYFPDGKEGLAVQAVEHTSRVIEANIRSVLDGTDEAAVAIPAFMRALAQHVEDSGFRAGGPITTIALESASTNDSLRLACRDAYRLWQAAFAEKLRADRFASERTTQLSVLLIAAIEGAILLCRSERSIQPLLNATGEIERLLRCDEHKAKGVYED
jgi:TetR/AcrR family transcriptional repressor of lmrAB and yxaGH operons